MNIYHCKNSDPYSDLQIPSPSNTININVLASFLRLKSILAEMKPERHRDACYS